jgi:diguanylate cyclase (GGDEF)-like protein
MSLAKPFPRESAPKPRGDPEEPPSLVRPEDEVGRFDISYVGALLALRWVILATYVLIVLLGLLPMHPLALLGSAGWIFATNCVALWYWANLRRGRKYAWYDTSYLYLDSLSVTFAMLATANLNYPVWLAYVLVMNTAAAEQSTRQSFLCTAWCLGGYLGSAALLAAAGWYTPSAGVLIVTACIMLFIGINLTITFDGSRRLRAWIRKMAVTDPLTGLANRRRLNDALANPGAVDRPLAVIVLDVDDFKSYNDAQGHLAGDRLLIRLAQTLRRHFPDAHTISRYGGDEFVVILPCESPEEAALRAGRLVAPGNPQALPVSLGLAVWPVNESTLDGALAAADDCLRAAKAAGKNRLVTAGRFAATAESGL